jgi:hypothetical protein
MMENVLRNNVYMQDALRYIIFKCYMKGITQKDRINYWENVSFDFNKGERQALFRMILEESVKGDEDEMEILKIRWDFALNAFEKYPEIMKDKDAFIRLKNILSESAQNVFFEKYLQEEMESPSVSDSAYNFILIKAYESYGVRAFDDALRNIKASARNYKQYIRAVCRLLLDETDKDKAVYMFDMLWKVYESTSLKNHIRREVDKKVWKEISENNVLYQERKEKIDERLKNAGQADIKEYKSFGEICSAINSYCEGTSDEKPDNIAYVWINMKSPEFEKSITESFTYQWLKSESLMKETYSSLFEHSIKWRGLEMLQIMCERIAKPLIEFAQSGERSERFDALDTIWVNYVVTNKLRGPKIKEYLFENHYDRVKEWQ